MHRVLLPFEFAEPMTVGEAVELVDGKKARILAGGVDLVLKMRLRQIVPELVVSIQKVPGLDYVRKDDFGLRFGAMASLRQIELSPEVVEGWPVLAEAICSIASAQTKVMGTAVGNLCVGTPASDVAPALYALGATARLACIGGMREIPIEAFFVDAGKTAVGPHEIVAEVFVPRPRAGTGGAFMKLSKTAEDVAKVNTAVTVTLADGVCLDAKIALGSVAPTPMRAVEAERLLQGRDMRAATVRDAAEAAAEAAAQAAAPISDVRSTEGYRREMVRILVKDALERAATRALADGGAG